MSKKTLLMFPLILLGCKNIANNPIEAQPNNHKAVMEMPNVREAELLNHLLESSRDSFSFQKKKIAFITGSSGNHIISKTDYFNTCVKPWLDKGKIPQISMVLLTPEEKMKSGGYDALVLSWVKVFSDKQRTKIINLLGK